MVQERAEVEPGTALLENPVDGLDKLDDVVSTVDEEACDDTVMTGDIIRGGVNFQKISSSHAKPDGAEMP